MSAACQGCGAVVRDADVVCDGEERLPGGVLIPRYVCRVCAGLVAPFTCAISTTLTPGQIIEVLQHAAGAPVDGGDVQAEPTCYLQERHGGAHYGLVLDRDMPDGSAVWAVWLPGNAVRLVVLPACLARSASGMDACTEPQGHVGGHTWQVRDPLMDVARAQLARMPLTGP